MAKKPGDGPLLGRIELHGDGLALTLYVGRRRLAVVLGSNAYVETALGATGLLAPPVAAVLEDGNGPGIALVSDDPPDGATKGTGEPDDGGRLDAFRGLAGLDP